MVDTILASPFMRDLLLPFMLVFAIVFAVLQKAKIFGEDKRQTDAIVALVIGLIVVAVGTTTHIITSLMPILAVGLVMILAFMLLLGFTYQAGQFDLDSKVKLIIGIVAAVAVVITVLYYTPSAWAYVTDLVSGRGSTLVTNAVFAILVIGAVVAVIYGNKSTK